MDHNVEQTTSTRCVTLLKHILTACLGTLQPYWYHSGEWKFELQVQYAKLFPFPSSFSHRQTEWVSAWVGICIRRWAWITHEEGGDRGLWRGESDSYGMCYTLERHFDGLSWHSTGQRVPQSSMDVLNGNVLLEIEKRPKNPFRKTISGSIVPLFYISKPSGWWSQKVR